MSDIGIVRLHQCVEGKELPYGIVQPGPYHPGGVPIVRVNNLVDGDFSESAVLSVAPEIAARYSRTALCGGEVLISLVGSIGRVFRVPESMSGWNVARAIAVIRPKSDIGADWLSYCLRSVETQKYLAERANTTVQTTVNLGDLRELAVPMPSRQQRDAICCVLRALDDRIDHNRALAANLEAIARALFKSWFVDFDPVRAKVAGETPPGLAPDLAALFPDRFVDSDLGEIPEGWKVVPLSQLVEVERGLSYKGSGLADRESGRPMHNLNSVLEGGGYKYTGIKFYSGDYKPRHIARAGDIVVANTEQGHKHLLIGFPAIIPASHEEGLFSHHLYRVRLLRDAKATKHWLYYALMAADVREQIIGHANGSTVNMLKPTGLQVPLVVLPPMPLCEQFDALAASIHARIENCVAESSALSDLRDLLLPRLISGKLRIEDAEAALEAA